MVKPFLMKKKFQFILFLFIYFFSYVWLLKWLLMYKDERIASFWITDLQRLSMAECLLGLHKITIVLSFCH